MLTVATRKKEVKIGEKIRIRIYFLEILKRRKRKFLVLLGVLLVQHPLLILFAVLTSWNPWNDSRVTFKVLLSLLNTLREYLHRIVFRQLESFWIKSSPPVILSPQIITLSCRVVILGIRGPFGE